MNLLEFNDGTRYIALFGSEKYEASYKRIRYFISLKSSITFTSFTITQKLKLILMMLYL